MNIQNLTQHDVNLYVGNECIKSLPPSGTVARVDEIRERASELLGVPLYRKTYGEVRNLPPAAPGYLFIVSSQVVDATRNIRKDLIAPDDLVRDNSGNIVGCRAFWYGG